MADDAKLPRHLSIIKNDYKMDLDIWEKSERGFPFNFSIEFVTFGTLFATIGLSVYLIPFENT